MAEALLPREFAELEPWVEEWCLDNEPEQYVPGVRVRVALSRLEQSRVVQNGLDERGRGQACVGVTARHQLRQQCTEVLVAHVVRESRRVGQEVAKGDLIGIRKPVDVRIRQVIQEFLVQVQ